MGKLRNKQISYDSGISFSGGNKIISNLADGVSANDAVNLSQLQATQTLIQKIEWKDSASDYVTDNTIGPTAGQEVTGNRLVLSHDGGTPHVNYDGAAAGDIIEFDGASWISTTPTLGTFIAVDDEPSLLYYWGGVDWSTKYFEATTASTGLTKVGFDVRLDSSAAGNGLTFNIDKIDLGGTLSGVTILDGGGSATLDIGGNTAGNNLAQGRINATSFQTNNLTAYDGSGVGTAVNSNPGGFSITNNLSNNVGNATFGGIITLNSVDSVANRTSQLAIEEDFVQLNATNTSTSEVVVWEQTYNSFDLYARNSGATELFRLKFDRANSKASFIDSRGATAAWGIQYEGFGEIDETGATADYSSLVGTSLVPKVWVEGQIAASPSIYTSDSTIGSGRVATLTDTLTFQGNGGLILNNSTVNNSTALISLSKAMSNNEGRSTYIEGIEDGATTNYWKIFSKGSSNFSPNLGIGFYSNNLVTTGTEYTLTGIRAVNSALSISNYSDTTPRFSLYGGTTNVTGNGYIKFWDYNATTQRIQIARSGLNYINPDSRTGGNGSIVLMGDSLVGSEKISLQGSTLVNDKFEIQTTTAGFLMPRMTTAQMNAIAAPDTHLLVFNTDLNGIYRYNGSAWVALSTGYGIIQLTQDSNNGIPVFYTDIQSALNDANTLGGDITITLHDNITTTAAISTNSTANIDNITFDLNGFTITNTANDSSAVIYNRLQSNVIRIINGSIIKTTGTGHALHFVTGIGDLYMSNCYVYSEAGSALKIDASITPVNIWDLGGCTFKTNTGYGVFLSDTLGGVSLRNFISISTGSGQATFLGNGGDVTNFKTIAETTGTALRVRSGMTSVTNFYAESNSGDCVLLESLLPIVKDFTAISVSGYAVFSSASAYKIENFYAKTTSGTRTINAPINSILINGDVYSDSTPCIFASDTERVENVNFTTNSGTYAVHSRFTTNWLNCTFRNKDGIAFYNYSASNSKLKGCTFISEKTTGGTAHAANINDASSVITFLNCDFEVADSTANCIKGDAAMNMKVANCSFDGATTAINANVTLSLPGTADAYGNILL